MYIIRTILRFPAAQQRTKAFSSEDEITINKGVFILINSISPMLNLFIYTLRNKQVKQAFNGLVKRILLVSKN